MNHLKISKYCVFDCETTGLDPLKNNLLTISFILLDQELGIIDRLNLAIKWTEYNTSVEALNINKEYEENVKYTYLSNDERLIEKIAEVTSGIKPILIGKEVIQKDL